MSSLVDESRLLPACHSARMVPCREKAKSTRQCPARCVPRVWVMPRPEGIPTDERGTRCSADPAHLVSPLSFPAGPWIPLPLKPQGFISSC